MPAAKWSIDKPASRRARPAVAGRGLSEGLGGTLRPLRLRCCLLKAVVVGMQLEPSGAAAGKAKVLVDTTCKPFNALKREGERRRLFDLALKALVIDACQVQAQAQQKVDAGSDRRQLEHERDTVRATLDAQPVVSIVTVLKRELSSGAAKGYAAWRFKE